ncbi:hypothetical protein FB567DRAFT_274113 [Paraphoma chrysanthemicola]|uniref:Uncharacterized protein n=1 Tax=Paraphoma chrysanthemicola TaxID=798071 RepID=A0A8K0W2N2_9PLEO|nr:hypothetical protein FB567DRAFT_274113 [Paraphoma chrysanthemicola]
MSLTPITSPSPLLQLPAEVRNEIVEFALTSSGPLHHCQPRTLFSPVRLQASYCHIFVEGKDIIDDQLERPLFNNLKLVCRQLHAETAGLEIRFNSLIFAPQSVSPFYSNPHIPVSYGKYLKAAEQWLFDFVAPMTPKKLQWLSTVIIASGTKCLAMRQSKAPPMPDLSSLAMFCKQHPHIDVRYQFSNWDLESNNGGKSLNFLAAGVCLIAALHGDELGRIARNRLVGFNLWAQILHEEARHWREIWNVQYLLKGIENFAFWPTAELSSCRSILERDAVNLEIDEERLNWWQQYTSDWISHGISGDSRSAQLLSFRSSIEEADSGL